MIDEKKLIEDIEKEFVGVCVYDVSPSQAVADFVEIVDRQPIIDRQPKVDGKDTNVPSKWIPCSERLPECEWGAETEALMYQVGDTIYTGHFGRGGLWRDEYFRGYADIKEGVDAESVIAWMPMLPAFVEGDKE